MLSVAAEAAGTQGTSHCEEIRVAKGDWLTRHRTGCGNRNSCCDEVAVLLEQK